VIDQLPFKQIWLADFEFISKAGERPDVVCLCARELRTGQTLRLWRNELGPRPPYSIDDDALFVCYVANAECACHMALGWLLKKSWTYHRCFAASSTVERRRKGKV
jgi:hypothetical protein